MIDIRRKLFELQDTEIETASRERLKKEIFILRERIRLLEEEQDKSYITRDKRFKSLENTIVEQSQEIKELQEELRTTIYMQRARYPFFSK